jgi:hypothetical protein
MKLSPSSVKRVWMHWTKTKMLQIINKFRRNKRTLVEVSVKLILEVHKEQNLGARLLERIIEHKHGTHIPHNAIHKELLFHGLANVNCAVLDDSSRRILAGREFDAETTDNALRLLKGSMDRFGWLIGFEQLRTDRGTQFYANKRYNNDWQGRIRMIHTIR